MWLFGRVKRNQMPVASDALQSDFAKQAGSIYTKLIEDEVKKEQGREASIQQRGLAVITTSGTLVTLLFALVAVITKSNTFDLPSPARTPLAFALALFLIAAISAIATNWPARYLALDTRDLERLLTPAFWSGSSSIAARRVAETQLELLADAIRRNNYRAWVLIFAMSAEVLAILFVALSVNSILRTA